MEILLRQNIDAERIVHDLSTTGASNMMILSEPIRRQLLEEAQGYSYLDATEYVNLGKPTEVRQQLASFENFPDDSLFFILKDALQTELDYQFRLLDRYPFTTPLRLNAQVLQKHPPNSIGITTHLDKARYINLVAVIALAGEADFYTYFDRFSPYIQKIETIPGMVVLMRAPGFAPLDGQQFHSVGNIKEQRYTYGLRQIDALS